MTPVAFKEQNTVFAKDQPEYLPLPAHLSRSGDVTSCWKMTLRERLRVLMTGRIYWTQMTFFRPLQPQRASTTFEDAQLQPEP